MRLVFTPLGLEISSPRRHRVTRHRPDPQLLPSLPDALPDPSGKGRLSRPEASSRHTFWNLEASGAAALPKRPLCQHRRRLKDPKAPV